MIFITSDTHFDHSNIIKYSNRPFSNVDEMNETIISNWNNKVCSNDDIYHLGDFSFSNNVQRWVNLLYRLNGNIFLIMGNHDRDNIIKKVQSNKGKKFIWFKDLTKIKIQDKAAPGGIQEIVLCHYAMKVWNKSHYGSWHLYGHSHDSLKEDLSSKSMDVGVDTNNFTPYSYEEIKKILDKRPGHIIDHHKERK